MIEDLAAKFVIVSHECAQVPKKGIALSADFIEKYTAYIKSGARIPGGFYDVVFDSNGANLQGAALTPISNYGFAIAYKLSGFYTLLREYENRFKTLYSDKTNDEKKTISRKLRDNDVSAVNDLNTRITSLPADEKDLVFKFLTNYEWWHGGKEVGRTNDFVNSPLLKCANLVAAANGAIPSLATQFAENPDLFSSFAFSIGSDSLTIKVDDIDNKSKAELVSILLAMEADTQTKSSAYRVLGLKYPVSISKVGTNACKQILADAGLPDSYDVEINKGIKLHSLIEDRKWGLSFFDGRNTNGSDLFSMALKMFAACRGTESPGGWSNYDEWTKGVREEFSQVDESLLDDPAFAYADYLRKYSISWQVVNTKFAPHTDAEKHAVLKFLHDQKTAPKSASWYIDDDNRLKVGGKRVDGMSAKTLLYFMSELHPNEFAPWTEPTYEGLVFLGLHNGFIPKDLTIEAYEDCKAKQHQIITKMKELGIGKASDDASDPDYRTVNEFIWWMGKETNRDLIKEKVMSKAMKKPTAKKITTGKAEISKLLGNKDDSLMTMLIAGLLTKPLAILAGVSGTGKSRMVRHLAYKTCLDEDLKPNGESAPGNFKMVQVKPSWHDSADLLGYRSAVNEKHEYVSTDFVKFVLKAHAYPTTPFFVCLDEMNLAPVEHYFAEFLSACESIRKSDVTGEWTSDPIVAATDFDNNVLNLGGDVLFESSDTTLDAELKKTKARIEKEGLFIPRNLFVVGTVNMDDSTGGFSRKVLDRAMTIVMNEVHFEDLRKDDKDLTLSDENLFKTNEIDKFIGRKDFDKGMLEEKFCKQLEDIRQKLEKTPFALAYRFARETCMYKNALKEILDAKVVVKDSEGNPKKDGDIAIDADRACGDIALDHMILMKLLPRLTGTTEQRKQVIDDINAFLGSLIKEKKVSKETLSDMVERASGNGGYLSFWP